MCALTASLASTEHPDSLEIVFTNCATVTCDAEATSSVKTVLFPESSRTTSPLNPIRPSHVQKILGCFKRIVSDSYCKIVLSDDWMTPAVCTFQMRLEPKHTRPVINVTLIRTDTTRQGTLT